MSACYRCRFFKVTRAEPKPELSEGWCKRFPPNPVQPIVLGVNWCGEFAEQEIPIKMGVKVDESATAAAIPRTPGVV